MSNLLSEANAFYFIASSLATLTLLTSLALIVTSNVPLPLILALATLSVLVLALSYKIISNNKKLEVERNKFAQKEQELENKITLGKEAEEAANKEVKNQLRELTREKQNLDKRAKKLNQKVNESEAEKESLLKEKESLEQKLEAKINRVFEITGKLEKITKEKDELGEQEEELLCKILRLCEQLQEKENDIAKKEERITELKRKIDNNKHVELQNEEFHKEIEKLSKEKHTLYNKKEELYKRQKELYVELDELQCRFKEINQKNKNLSQELKKKFEELNKANGLIENQSFELDEIRKDYDNKVKKLQNLLLGKDSQIAQLEEDLKEIVSLIQRAIQHIAREVEKPIRRSRDNNIEAVLKKVSGEIQVIKSLLKELKETAVQHLSEPVKDSKCESPSDETPASSLEDLVYASSPNETSVPLHAGDPGYESEGDSGYGLPNSCLSTPTKLPISPWAERCRRSQFRNVELVKCDD